MADTDPTVLLQIRLAPGLKRRFEYAASLRRMSLDEFMIWSARQSATMAVREHETAENQRHVSPLPDTEIGPGQRRSRSHAKALLTEAVLHHPVKRKIKRDILSQPMQGETASELVIVLSSSPQPGRDKIDTRKTIDIQQLAPTHLGVAERMQRRQRRRIDTGPHRTVEQIGCDRDHTLRSGRYAAGEGDRLMPHPESDKRVDRVDLPRTRLRLYLQTRTFIFNLSVTQLSATSSLHTNGGSKNLALRAHSLC